MSDGPRGSILSGADFTRGMLSGLEKAAVLDAFGGQGLITDVLAKIGDGKEATVYCCEADPSVGVPFLAAKVYRAQKFRAFSGNRGYVRGRSALDSRSARALHNKSRHGKSVAHAEWLAWEWQVLCDFHDAGGAVPEPLSRSEDAILMEYVGDGPEAPAPQLRHVRLEPEQTRLVIASLLTDVERLLDLHLVHGDLSPYNVLYWQDRPWIIDLPQAVDARTHPDALRLLRRDVENVCRYGHKQGVSPDAGRTTHALWSRYRKGELGR